MLLPENLKMKNTAHGHGAKGMAFYSYEDAEGLGVMVDARRKTGRDPFVETFRFRWLPGGEFASYRDLREGVAALTEEQVAAEKAKWPQLSRETVEREASLGGKCWSHTDRPATHSGCIQRSWHEFDVSIAMLCEECAAASATDPGVIERASAKRIADVAERREKRNA